MNRAHTYSQIPVSENSETSNRPRDSEDDNDSHRNNLALARSQKSPVNNSSASADKIVGSNSTKGKGRLGYAALNNNDEDDDDFEDAGEDSVMLRPLASSSKSSGSAPRRPIYQNDDDDDDEDNDNEISVAMPTEGSSSSSSNQTNKDSISMPTRQNSGIRTTNRSFLARLTGRQRPDRDAQRMVRSAVDGVFSNLSAKPRVEKPYEEELPPAYKTAAMDVSPVYQETMLPPGFSEDDDTLLVDGLPVGNYIGFVSNMTISVAFQFVGFFLTYLLHTSHSTKEGSKAGLGITFISMGYRMLTRTFNEDEDYSDQEDNTGYMGNTGNTSYTYSLDYDWLSYLFLFFGGIVVIQSVASYTRAKLQELKLQRSALASEAAVPASAAAGAGLTMTVFPGADGSSSRNDGAIIVAMLS
ncbi:hypothetical protein BGZ76_011754 [Entomortierella beljakovae]|nr:hypothetical protein BGZ76_011754 [Entomortierella beljakovae]